LPKLMRIEGIKSKSGRVFRLLMILDH
jgi:hypothetical protein